jgi:hypothetical protein
LVRPEGPSFNSHVRKGVVIRTKAPVSAAGAAPRHSQIVSPICSANEGLTFVSVPARRASRILLANLTHVREGVVTDQYMTRRPEGPALFCTGGSVPHLRCSHSLLPVNHALTDVATECRPSGPLRVGLRAY